MSVWIFAAHVLERDTMCKSDVNSLLTAFWMSAKYPGGAPLAVFYKHREGWIHEYVNKHIHKKRNEREQRDGESDRKIIKTEHGDKRTKMFSTSCCLKSR